MKTNKYKKKGKFTKNLVEKVWKEISMKKRRIRTRRGK